MKYIDIEFQHQMICMFPFNLYRHLLLDCNTYFAASYCVALPFETAKDDSDKQRKASGLDDSDLYGHKIDYKVWKGMYRITKC